MDGATTIVPDTVPAPATLAEARARIPGWADLPKARKRDLRDAMDAVERIVGAPAA
jgi:hypothetical protein